MTRVRFYHNAHDPVGLACELVARAHAGGRRIAVRVPDAATARRFDQLLWSFEPLAFVPHVMADSPLAAQTTVVVGLAHEAAPWPHQDLLFNLAGEPFDDFGRFRMVVEIVGQDEQDRLPARARWMRYKSAGLALEAFDAVRRDAL